MLVETAASNSSFISALRRDFGFSAVILNPPGTSGWGGSSPAVFQQAVTAFSEAGLGVVLYSSIVHAGEDPVWTSGNLSRQHPEWLQRHRDGKPWLLETKPALSPFNDAAIEFTLNRTLALLATYPQANGIMLDNSELCPTGNSLCDYSDAALAKWRAYLSLRFGTAWTARCLGVSDPASAVLPNSAANSGSPLFGVWSHFRDRQQGLGLEAFRVPLHAHRDGTAAAPVALFANTELEWPDMALATRLQPEHEDAVSGTIFGILILSRPATFFFSATYLTMR